MILCCVHQPRRCSMICLVVTNATIELMLEEAVMWMEGLMMLEAPPFLPYLVIPSSPLMSYVTRRPLHFLLVEYIMGVLIPTFRWPEWLQSYNTRENFFLCSVFNNAVSSADSIVFNNKVIRLVNS